MMDKYSAENYLTNNNINIEVLEKTHCNPPENYFITSEDMVNKAGVWGHFGSWDFKKAAVWNIINSNDREKAIIKIKDALKISEKEAEKYYFDAMSLGSEVNANTWIAPWPGYGGSTYCSNIDNNTIDCSGAKIDLTTKDIEGERKPYSIIYLENDSVVEKIYENGIAEQSIILRYDEDNNRYVVTIASPVMATSLFTKLFMFDGIGLNHFKEFTRETQPSGGQIIVWKVEW